MTKRQNITDTDLVRKFSLLIKKIKPGIHTTVDFLVMLNGMISEAKEKNAENLIIAVPFDSILFQRKIKSWIIQYLLPQMKEIGLKRVAIVLRKSKSEQNRNLLHPDQDPEIRIFTDIAEATGWIMRIPHVPEQYNNNNSCCYFIGST